MRVNVQGTETLISACRDADVKCMCIIVIITVVVFGSGGSSIY